MIYFVGVDDKIHASCLDMKISYLPLSTKSILLFLFNSVSVNIFPLLSPLLQIFSQPHTHCILLAHIQQQPYQPLCIGIHLKFVDVHLYITRALSLMCSHDVCVCVQLCEMRFLFVHVCVCVLACMFMHICE